MKKVLMLSYSHVGQTRQALLYFAQGLEDNIECKFINIEPTEIFHFPWTVNRFFRVFPRCVRGVNLPNVNEINIKWEDYDLVILGFQIWFLSPSLPMQGFLASPYAAGLKNKKVITIVTCRNLYASASEVVSSILKKLGAKHLGQITLCETSPLWASFVTTPRWMLTGCKSAFSFFPPAGIAEEEFKKLVQKGSKISKSWIDSNGQSVTESEFGSNLNRVSLQLMDVIGYHFFLFWSAFILKCSSKEGPWQDFLLLLFRANLILLIISVAPLTKIYEVLVKNKKIIIPPARFQT